MIQLLNGDCLELMQSIPDKSVDMVMCDLPYGTTQNKWDTVIPLDQLWTQYDRLCRGAVVLTATQPFSSVLVTSNIERFKYEWVWRKSRVTGVLNAKHQPLRCHELVLVFCEGKTTYNAQGVVSCDKRAWTGRASGKVASSSNYGAITPTEDGSYHQTETNHPRSVLEIPSVGGTVHPSPIEPRAALMLDLPKGIGGVVTSSPAGSGALLFR